MRRLDIEEKTSVLQKTVEVELTVLELMTIKTALGNFTTQGMFDALQRTYNKLDIPNSFTDGMGFDYLLFSAIGEILEEEGVE